MKKVFAGVLVIFPKTSIECERKKKKMRVDTYKMQDGHVSRRKTHVYVVEMTVDRSIATAPPVEVLYGSSTATSRTRPPRPTSRKR